MRVGISITNYSWPGGPAAIAGHLVDVARRVDAAQPGTINHLYGGRGVYFEDPDGHLMELITTPYAETPAREPVRISEQAQREPSTA